MWPFTQEHIGELIWTEIVPRLKALESQTWNEILVKDKKQNLNDVYLCRLIEYFMYYGMMMTMVIMIPAFAGLI